MKSFFKNRFSVLSGFSTADGIRELNHLRIGVAFAFPKPTTLIRLLTEQITSGHDIVADFFAGAGSTGHGVLRQNAMDGQHNRYILLQLPEMLDLDDKDLGAAVRLRGALDKPHNIAKLTKERLRHATQEIKNETPMFAGDLGGRVFNFDASNIRVWEPGSSNIEVSLVDSIDHIKSDRSEQDVHHELLLKLGFDPCVPIEPRPKAGKPVCAIGTGTLMAYLGEKIAWEEVELLAHGIAYRHAEIEISDDSVFADDVTKTNHAAILQQRGLSNMRNP